MIQGANTMLLGWPAIGILALVWFIAFTIRMVKSPDEYANALIVSNFSVTVVAVLFFAGELIHGGIVMIPVILLVISLILKAITK